VKKPILATLIFFVLIFSSINLVYATEFFSNGDFEDGKTVWFFSGSSDVDSSTVYEGSYSGVLPTENDWLKQPGSGVWNDGAGGITNHTHLSFYGIHDGSGLQTLQVIAEYHDETSDMLEYNLTSSWTKYNVFPDLDPVKGIYHFRFQSPPDATVDFFVDFVTFGDGAEPTPPPAPTSTPPGEILAANFTQAALLIATLIVILNLIIIIKLMGDHNIEALIKEELAIIILALVLLVLAAAVTSF